MKFKPCIDIHDGIVKQIVGGTLSEKRDCTKTNFVSCHDATYYAQLYKDRNLPGGHVIMLNPLSSPYYEASRQQALSALSTYRGGLHAGGGINPQNADIYLDAGASHVIVTSYVFNNGKIDEAALNNMVSAVGKEKLVLDLSCRQRDGAYHIVTDRWQKFTDVLLTEKSLNELSGYCDEFLVHGADVEGLQRGIQKDLVKILSKSPIPVTYAGGVSDYSDLELIKTLGEGRVDVTIGTALDIFGGSMEFDKVLEYFK